MKKEALILLVVASGYRQYLERFGELPNAAGVVAYCALFLVMLAALLASASIKSTTLRCLFGVMLSLSYVLYDAFFAITGEFLTYSMFIVLLESAGFGSEALTQYFGAIAVSAAKGLGLLVGIVLPPRPSRRSSLLATRALPVVAPVAASVLLSALLFVRGGRGSTGLPGPFPPLSFGSLLVLESLVHGSKQRRDVDMPRSGPGGGKDIVLVIDESIRADYLDINSPLGVNSSLKNAPGSVRVINYGLAAAISNCSVGSNICLRYGGTRKDYTMYIESMPSIWRYAKKAGYTTVYLDAQRTGGKLQNRMNSLEQRDIDRFVQFDGVPLVDRDMAVADALAELSRNTVPELVVVNKIGAHFPIHNKYPDAWSVHKPELPREEGGYDGATDENIIHSGFGGEWDLYKNSYKNTLLWNVGRFFEKIVNEVDFTKTIVLYTSDHGQGFHERGNPGLSTHCSSNPMIEEGLVPLVVLVGGAGEAVRWEENLKHNFNHASHYTIFPTLLSLMGYDQSAIRQHYGQLLTDSLDDPLTFNARFEARLGLKPVWVRIDPAKVVGPGS